MTYSDNIRKLVNKQTRQERKLDRLKTVEKSARTDDIIRKQVDDEGQQYVEIGLNLVDHAQLVPNGSFNDGETGWIINLEGDPGRGSWYYWMALSELNVGIQPIEKCNASIECAEPIYLHSTGVIHEYHMYYMNVDLGNSYFIKWTLSVTEYSVDDEIVTVNSVTLTNPQLGVDLDLNGSFTPSAETAYVKIKMYGIVPEGIKIPTDMQSVINGVSLKGLGTGDSLIEANGTRTTLNSVWTDLGIVSATNISATPTANYIPKADGTGKLDVGWMPSTIDADKLDGNHASAFATSGHDHTGTYLPLAGKAADADKLDGNDSTGFVQTSGNQTVGGIKTFSSIPVLPSSDPTTANQAVRKGYADATYLGISEKASGSDVGTGTNDTKFVTPLALQSAFGITAAGKALIDDSTVSEQRNTLKLKQTSLSPMNDNTATSITPTNASGFLLVRIAAGTGAGSFALLSYDATTGTAYATLMVGSANIAVTTGALAGTTGTDGKLTISAHTDGKIYVENRLGGTAYIGYLAL